MKKTLIASILGIAVIGGGAYAMTVEKPEETPKKEQVEKAEPKTETTATEVKEEKPKAPTERETPITGRPWDAYGGIEVMEKVKAGEVVYLYEDGEALETELLNFTKSPSKGKKDWWHTHTMAYVANVSPHYPDKQAYFDKLTEIQEALLASNFEVIPTKIEEARKLRAE